MLKLACQEKFVKAPTMEGRLNQLSELGFDAVELRGKGLIADGGKQARRVLANSRLPVSAICMGYRGAMLSDNSEERALARCDVQWLLEMAEELKAAGVVVVLAYDPYLPPSMLPRHLTPEVLRERALGELAQLAEFSLGMKAAILLEARNRYETPLLRTLEEGAELLEQLNSPNVKLLADTFHLNIEQGQPTASLTRLAPYIGYVHLADNHRLLPGMGSLNFRDLFAALLAGDYSGYLSLEVWDDAKVELEPHLPETVRFLRQCIVQAESFVSGYVESVND
jgi:sugar phosphate isomerase/epimerase